MCVTPVTSKSLCSRRCSRQIPATPPDQLGDSSARSDAAKQSRRHTSKAGLLSLRTHRFSSRTRYCFEFTWRAMFRANRTAVQSPRWNRWVRRGLSAYRVAIKSQRFERPSFVPNHQPHSLLLPTHRSRLRNVSMQLHVEAYA